MHTALRMAFGWAVVLVLAHSFSEPIPVREGLEPLFVEDESQCVVGMYSAPNATAAIGTNRGQLVACWGDECFYLCDESGRLALGRVYGCCDMIAFERRGELTSFAA